MVEISLKDISRKKSFPLLLNECSFSIIDTVLIPTRKEGSSKNLC
jgi:hypothetical protein